MKNMCIISVAWNALFKIVFFPICFEYYSEQNKNASAACQDEVRVTMGTLVCVDIIICLF